MRRVQTSDGRTRAFVNDQPVSAQALRAIGASLVEIHCQHDDRALVDPSAHRALVDAHGGRSARRRRRCASCMAPCSARAATLAEEEARVAKARAEADYLRHANDELEALAPQPGEEAALAERRQTMQRSEKVAGDLRDALAAFSGDHSPAGEIASAARRLERRATAGAAADRAAGARRSPGARRARPRRAGAGAGARATPISIRANWSA